LRQIKIIPNNYSITNHIKIELKLKKYVRLLHCQDQSYLLKCTHNFNIKATALFATKELIYLNYCPYCFLIVCQLAHVSINCAFLCRI